MEETGTNIHTGLVRRNNFLGENPTSWKFVAGWGKTTRWRARRATSWTPQGYPLPTRKRNDTARSGAYRVGMRPTLVSME